MKYKSFHPGQPWLDTNGKRIHAHGGSIFYENGRYYWYGENKEKTTGLDSIWHWGIRCYVSGDLYNWDDLGLIIPPEPDDPASTLHPSKCVDRPHILYNRKTGKYVCSLKVMSVGCTVLTADALLGPYTVVHEGLWPLGMEPGALINRKLYIPNYPQGKETSESLNVAIATAVICAEFRRQAAWK